MAEFEGITTKTGDQGESAMYSGERLDKDDLLFELVGTSDELNSWLGLIRAHICHGLDVGYTDSVDCEHQLLSIQKDLFRLGAEIATSPDSALFSTLQPLHQPDLEKIEEFQLTLMRYFKLPQEFIIPGGHKLSARIDIARNIARRLERLYVRYKRERAQVFNPHALRYINRLSDLLFSMARYYEQK